jgi:hypothetical protein
MKQRYPLLLAMEMTLMNVVTVADNKREIDEVGTLPGHTVEGLRAAGPM